MGYKFRKVGDLRKLLANIFSEVSGHDHDGVNSKTVTVGTPANDSVTTAKIAAGALSADAAGRGKFANDFFDAATALAKFAADSLTNTVLLKLVQDGAFVADAATRALFANGFLPLAKMADTAKTHVLSFQIEDLAAGGDIVARSLFSVPAGLQATLISAAILPLGNSAGVDNANTSVIELTDGTNSIVSKTYNTGTQPPAAGVLGDLGALDGTHKVLAAAENLVLNVTNGATADLAGMFVQVVLKFDEA